MAFVPSIVEATPAGERGYDIFSRLLKDRIILLCDEVNTASASTVIAQLLYLAAEDPNKDISLYINSPGGSVSDGLAIIDTMNFIQPDVKTICVGMAASMGATIFASGAKGKRFMLPNSEFMIHQPLGGAKGQCADIQISARHIESLRKKLNTMLSNASGLPIDKIEVMTDRDNFLTADEAVNLGFADKIIQNN